MTDLSALRPNDGQPIFTFTYTRSIVFRLLVQTVFAIGLALTILPTFTSFESNPAGYLVLFFILALGFSSVLYAYRGIFARLKTFKFYEDSVELSGWKFRRSFSYEDIDRLWLTRSKVWIFSEDVVWFTIKGEPFRFHFANPKNKKLQSDLHSWMAKKLPASALQPARTMFERANPT